MRRAALVALSLFAVPAAAQDAPDIASLVRRLEAAEARIEALEDEARARGGTPAAPPSAAVAPAPAAVPPVHAAAARPEDKRPQGAVDQPPERPITHQLVSLTFNGLVQAWYAAGNEGFRDTFRIRRTELYFNGQITNKARWQVMVDPSKALALETPTTVAQSTRILQNAIVTFDYNPRMRWTIGQFKLPLGLEGQMSSGRLDTVERALFASDRARGGAYADVRDIGLMVRAGSGSRLDLQAGLFNGVAESQNETDRNDQKALAGNLVVRPAKGLHLGTSGAWGNGGGDRPDRDRLGFEAQFARGPWTLRSEVMTGHDGAIHRRGAYAHAGYRFGPRFEGVARVDGWDPDTRSESDGVSVRELDYVGGVNVFLSQHNLKLQANVIRKTFRDGVLPARNVVLVNTQSFW